MIKSMRPSTEPRSTPPDELYNDEEVWQQKKKKMIRTNNCHNEHCDCGTEDEYHWIGVAAYYVY